MCEKIKWGSEKEIEIRNRILISVYAYSYEFLGISLVNDIEFDELCCKINPNIITGRILEDEFFKNQFSNYTGMWIRIHPSLAGIISIYEKYFTKTIN